MILDQISHADRYFSLGPVWKQALSVMQNYDPAAFQKGKTSLPGGIQLVQLEYVPKDPAGLQLEAHRQYADIMFLPQGQELLFYKPLEALTQIRKPYDEAIDALLTPMEPDALAIPFAPGSFAVFFPEDAHCAGGAAGQAQTVRRIVIKVPLDD